MGAFLVDEQDTLISQPWPPHYQAAAGEILNTRVLELLRGPCPDNPMKGHTWPLRSILERTVYVKEGMNLRDRSQYAILSRLLYDAIDPVIDSHVHEDYLISVSLLRWATRYAHQHLFRLVGIFTDSKAHCDKWGLELPGMAPTKRTYVPEAGSGGKRSLTPQSNQVRPTAHPDPYPAVNKLISEIVTDLLCFEGPTALYSYTVKELLVRLTTLSVNMGYAKRSGIRLFRNYLRMCAAEHSLPTVDDQLVFCIGLL